MRRCRCHSRKTYRRCCEPLHEGRAAPSPEALMRSRYAAYALGLVDYIMDTTDPSGPHFVADPEAWRQQLAAFSRQTRFEGLDIEATGDDWVQFHARLTRGGTDASFRERSRFTRVDGRWRYHSGTSPER